MTASHLLPTPLSSSSKSNTNRASLAQPPAKTRARPSIQTSTKSVKKAIVGSAPKKNATPKSVRLETSTSMKSVSTKAATSMAENGAPKAKRSRIPTDFADKYSGPQKERKIVAALPTVEKKARKTTQERENLRRLMTPDDELVQRLSRVATTMNVSNSSRKPRRKAHWESRCGKCGVTATFFTPAALCAKCGAIAVRVLD